MRLAFLAICATVSLASAQPLSGTAPLEATGDLALEMVAGIDRYLDVALNQAVQQRDALWSRDTSTPEAYTRSVEPNRARLKTRLGIVDTRLPVDMQYIASVDRPALRGDAATYRVYAVRWPVLEGVFGEGLLLEPKGTPKASIVALPDCDQTPEMLAGLVDGIPPASQFARRLVEQSCRVIVPVLIDRANTFSGTPDHMTNQPHREYVYRAAFEMGRHIIGYEVQKGLAAVDWMQQHSQAPIGVIGYGEGGLIAFYAGAVDSRIAATAVSAYFSPHEPLSNEPIYRNVWGLLREFGDAEIATLIAPRTLIVDAADSPQISGPPDTEGRRPGAPGVIATPAVDAVQREAQRARDLTSGLGAEWISVIAPENGAFGGTPVLQALFDGLGVTPAAGLTAPAKANGVVDDANERMQRQIAQLLQHNALLVERSPQVRDAFWGKADRISAETWVASTQPYRDYFWDEVIGRLPASTSELNPRSRMIYDTDAYIGYEVKLDVLPEVYAYGILLVPKNLQPDERRPVVVCQHGLEGRPQEVVDETVDSHFYHHFGSDLAREGFIVYAPQNPYIGENAFRQLQRKANPLKLSIFSFITSQHEQTLKWLSSLPFVDPERIAFYGLSYGGKTAMRVPALLPQYCLSICSGDFNEWIWKMTSYRAPFSYAFTHEYEMYEFDLGNTFNYFELSTLIFPRPFMVERGHDDGVSIDEWVSYEYAKVRRFYNKMGHGDRTTIEYFDGPHEIHAVGTFEFLRHHLRWPAL